MKAKRIVIAALMSVIGCLFLFAGCDDTGKITPNDHEHNYVWQVVKEATCSSEGEEKGVCECGDETTRSIPIDKNKHQLGEEVTVTEGKEPTCYSKGEGTKKCELCGSVQVVELDYAAHTLKHYDEVPATCAKDGVIEYWECEVCGRTFTDAEATEDAPSTTIPKESIEHHYVDGVCDVCHAVDPEAGHVCVPTFVQGVEANCSRSGEKDHYVCSCGKIYLDAEATQLVEEEDLFIPVTNDHKGEVNAEHHPAVPSPDCATYGIKEHWDCKECGKHFKTNKLDPKEELIDLEQSTEVTEVGENTLQDAKLTTHKMVKHEVCDATCVAIGWEEECYECETCHLTYKATDYDSVWNKPKENATPANRAELVEEINPSHHCDEPTKHDAKEPSRCGRSEYDVGYNLECYECTLCHQYFKNDDCTDPLDSNEVLKLKDHGEMREDAEENSTCTVKGHVACWTCTVCQEHFKIQNPTAETLPMSEEEYYLQLAPHEYTVEKKDSRGHWNACKNCGANEKEDDGVTDKIEKHVYSSDDESECEICGYGNVEWTDFFDITSSTDVKTKKKIVKITGLKKDSKGQFEIAKTDETVLRIPSHDKQGNLITMIAKDALGTRDHPEYKDAYKNIREVVIPNTITTVEEYAFAESVTSGYFFETITFEPGEETVSLGEHVFEADANLKKLVLPKFVDKIPNAMVQFCTSLTEIQMPEEVRGNDKNELIETFKGCSSLKSVDLWCLKEKHYSLKNWTFHMCESLETVFLPKNLDELGVQCFAGCYNIQKIYYQGTQTDWTGIQKNEDVTTYSAWNYNVARLQKVEEYLQGGYVPGSEQ